MSQLGMKIPEVLRIWSQYGPGSTYRQVADYVTRLEDAYEQAEKPLIEVCDDLPGILDDVEALVVKLDDIDAHISVIDDIRSLIDRLPDSDDIEELSDIQADC